MEELNNEQVRLDTGLLRILGRIAQPIEEAMEEEEIPHE